MAIEKDESINKREVIVNFLAFHICDMIKLAALSEAGIDQAPNVTIKLELKMKNRDSLGYERDTESLAEGARVIITVDRDWKAPEPDPVVDFAPKPYNDPPAEGKPSPFEDFEEPINPQRKRYRRSDPMKD